MSTRLHGPPRLIQGPMMRWCLGVTYNRSPRQAAVIWPVAEDGSVRVAWVDRTRCWAKSWRFSESWTAKSESHALRHLASEWASRAIDGTEDGLAEWARWYDREVAPRKVSRTVVREINTRVLDFHEERRGVTT